MKRWRFLVGALIAWLSLLALGEVFPVFTVGFWRLSVASRFVMFSGIDNPYARLPEAKLFLRIYGSGNPESAFLQLYRFGNQQAKAFALYGLHEIGSDRFEEVASTFVTAGGEVRLVVTTCSASEVPASTVLEFIRQ